MDQGNPEADILDHREIYRGRIVNLCVDTIRQESGAETIREVVRHPGGWPRSRSWRTAGSC